MFVFFFIDYRYDVGYVIFDDYMIVIIECIFLNCLIV